MKGRNKASRSWIWVLAVVVAAFAAVPVLPPVFRDNPQVRPNASAELAGPSTSGNRDVFVLPGDAAALGRAREIFESAGLEPPAVTAMFHSRTDPCDGYRGLYRTCDDGASIVNVCVCYNDPDASEAARARTLLHEMAHAWIAMNVSADQIEDFLDVRGLEVWIGEEVPWERQGYENAAEILMWGMTDGDLALNLRLGANVTSLPEAYRTLIGGAPQAAAETRAN